MYVKIMNCEDIPDDDPRKTFRLYEGVVSATFLREDDRLFVELGLIGGGFKSELATGNVYILNDLGEVIQSIGEAPYHPETEAVEMPEGAFDKMLLGALDALGLALADHGHVWTDEERTAYEESVRGLLNPAPAEPVVEDLVGEMGRPMPAPEPVITGELRNAVRVKVLDNVIFEGNLYNDIHKRWEDGTYIHTSAVVSTDPQADGSILVQTRNSLYRVFPKQNPLFDKVVTRLVKDGCDPEEAREAGNTWTETNFILYKHYVDVNGMDPARAYANIRAIKRG